jgi:hypothetical protein
MRRRQWDSLHFGQVAADRFHSIYSHKYFRAAAGKRSRSVLPEA